MKHGATPVVLAATSGTGKTTLARRLVSDRDRYVFSISATTRSPREGEVDGVDYHFLEPVEFERLIESGAFAEWARVHGRYYGTPRAELEAAAARGDHVVLDIDVQGARQLRTSVPWARQIFVLPPSVEVLMERLGGRGTEDGAEVALRLRSALSELQAVADFDYVVINDDLSTCLEEIRDIVEGEPPERDRHTDLVEGLRADIEQLLSTEYRTYEHGITEE
jgi:guanylate kinase